VPADFERRAADLAVERYGADRVRVCQAAQAVLEEQAAGGVVHLIDRLVAEKLLTSAQAAALATDLNDATCLLPLSASSCDTRTANDLAETRMSGERPVGHAETRTRSGHYIRSLGDYRLLRKLGEGGMGSVFLGFNAERDEYVAIKVLADALSDSASYIARFHREAKNGCRLQHPNIVRCICDGQDSESGKHYLVMEFVDGPSARTLLNNFGRMPVCDAVHITLDIARALDYVHARNFVHRDIKPDNILLTKDGAAKLADLGLAKCLGEDAALTARHQGFGTPFYMPCEQAIDARLVDGRSDLFALGATLYHFITGKVPFPGATPLQVAERKLAGTFVPASRANPAVPAAIDRILNKLLARDAKDRYQSAKELIMELEDTGLDGPGLSLLESLSPESGSLRARALTGATTLADSAVTAAPAPALPDGWYVRYLGTDGQWCKTRATVAEIRQRLRDGHLPISAEVSRELHGIFQPCSYAVEFRDAVPPRATAATSWLQTLAWGLTFFVLAAGSAAAFIFLRR
jgi:serine/threonine-protein kinase